MFLFLRGIKKWGTSFFSILSEPFPSEKKKHRRNWKWLNYDAKKRYATKHKVQSMYKRREKIAEQKKCCRIFSIGTYVCTCYLYNLCVSCVWNNFYNTFRAKSEWNVHKIASNNTSNKIISTVQHFTENFPEAISNKCAWNKKIHGNKLSADLVNI